MRIFSEIALLVAFSGTVGLRFSVPLLVWLGLQQSHVLSRASDEWATFLSTPATFAVAFLLTVAELALEFVNLDRPLARALGALKVLTTSLFVSATVVSVHPIIRLILGFFACQLLVVPLHLRRPGALPIECISRRAFIALTETALAYGMSLLAFAFPFSSALLSVAMRFLVNLFMPHSPQPVSIHPHRHEMEERFLWLVAAVTIVVITFLPLLSGGLAAPRLMSSKDPSLFVQEVVKRHLAQMKRVLHPSPIAAFDGFIRLTAQKMLDLKQMPSAHKSRQGKERNRKGGDEFK